MISHPFARTHIAQKVPNGYNFQIEIDKRFIWRVPIKRLICALCSVLLFLSAPAQADQVIGIADGDTLTVLRDRSPFKIRLANIDAPEKAQAFGNRAKESLSEMCFGKNADYTVQSLDRYKRAIAVVRCDGIEVNRQQVARGMAWVYVRYNLDRSLPDVENQAREAGIGLWRGEAAVAPWEFRRTKRLGKPAREARNDQVSR